MTSIPKHSNRIEWDRKFIQREYRDEHDLFVGEQVIFDELAEKISHASLLDIGIGTGRTTFHLEKRCDSYIGLDYSPRMLARARERFPNADLRVMDARDLSDFVDQSFDVVVFSFNGIDYTDHKGRIKILKEIRRVLRADGTFIFSAHRRGTTIHPAYHLSNFVLSKHPIRLAYYVVGYLRGIANAARMRGKDQQCEEYALLNDSANQYALLTYYITPKAQAAQLIENGFEAVRILNQSAEDIEATDAPPESPREFMTHYVAIKCET